VRVARRATVSSLPLYHALRETQKDRTSPTINQGDFMARIIVTTDPTTNQAAPVLLNESVYSIHLDNDHNAAQLIERLGWAISDAENTQRTEQEL
jgi:hypothetical protein